MGKNKELMKEYDREDNILQSIKQILVEIKELKSETRDIAKALDFVQNEVADINQQLKKQDNRITVMDQDLGENTKKVAELESKVHQLEQRSRINNVEINNIPEKKGENLLATVIKIGVKVGVKVVPEDVEVVHRVQRFNNNTAVKNIVCRFNSRQKKRELLEAVKIRRSLETSDLDFDGPSSKVYVNSHLSPFYKKLLMDAKKIAKEKNYKFVWSNDDGNIFVRQSEKSKVQQILTQTDLSKL